MKKLLIPVLLFGLAFGGVNEKYSYKSFKRQTFVNVDTSEFNNSTIVRSCFHQDVPFTEVFPANVVNLTLDGGNYDNVKLPAGATLIGGTNKQFVEKNDKEYWIVDSQLKPVIPRDTLAFKKAGVSLLPKDIPASPLSEPITITKDPDRILQYKIDSLAQDKAALRTIIENVGVAK